MVITVTDLVKNYRKKLKNGFWQDLFIPKYQNVPAINKISFSINKGESVAFLGPNGAGKTTTMKILSGLLYPTSGKIDVLGYFPFDKSKEYLMRIGLVMGNKSGLAWDLTPKQNFELTKKIYKISDEKYKKRVEQLTQLLDVGNFLDNQVRKLSLGERMKMELIASILHDPEILLLDEPTIGLDIISKQKIRKFLREIQKNTAVTMLLTSHDMIDVEKVCDRVIVINKGIKVYDDSLENLTNEYKKERFVKFTFKNIPEKIEIQKYGEIIESGENYYSIKIDNDYLSETIAKVTSKYRLFDIDILSIPLDEIIADIYRKSSVNN